jgi:heptosyltransferase-1
MHAARILVVRIGSLGDIIHTLPAVATLKHGFAGVSLSWLVGRRWACLLRGNPFVDRVIEYERRSMRGLREVWRELRKERYDIAVDFQGLVQSALVASLGRPDQLFGFHQAQVREKPAALFYSNKIKVSAAHVVDRNLELAASTGASSLLRTFALPEGAPEGDLPQGEFVLASPLAGWAGKQWPLEYYRSLARRLRDELGMFLVLNGPPESSHLLRAVPEAWLHLSGLPGLIHASRRALVVFGIDSGPLHLAAALGKPGVAVFGPTDPTRNGPYGNSFTVLRSPAAQTSYKRYEEVDPSMWEIRPDAVFEALKTRIVMQGKGAGTSA